MIPLSKTLATDDVNSDVDKTAVKTTVTDDEGDDLKRG